MDAPPPEDVRPFLYIGAHLAVIGLSVPQVYAADETAGLVLLEDFGDQLFPTVMTPGNQPVLFDAAVDALAAMQEAPPPVLPHWNPASMAATAEATLCEWWWPAAFGAPAPAEVREQFTAALQTMLAPLDAGPFVFVHRDYFAGNLMWLPERKGLRAVGILDFQGAAIGHPAYDLASLIEDDRRDIPDLLASRAVAGLLAARPLLDREAFGVALAICAAQRHLRLAGQWVRLARRDGKPHYLAHGPRTWRLLQAALRQPAVKPLAEVFARWIPPERRGNPPDHSGNAA